MMSEQPIIQLKNLSKSYGSKEVLKHITLDIYPGQVIGYIGPNGAGKSTTVKILTGLIPDFNGQVMVTGLNMASNQQEIKKLIGYVPENAEIYDVLTPMEYLDANAVIMIKELIVRLKQEGKTIFYCSHMMDVVEKVSDRILLINKGEIIADGTFESLKQNHSDTLERIFAKLTGREDNSSETDAVINAFD